jgi:transcriptional regulator with XRE-family HTH domain
MTPEEPTNIAFGRRIRRHRRSLGGLSQTEYGARYHVNQITVSNWERGKFRPSQDHMKMLEFDGFAAGQDGTSEIGSRQLWLPFEQAFLLELKIGPQRAGNVGVEVRLRQVPN